MMIFGQCLEFIGHRLVSYLTRPIPGFRPASTTDFGALQRSMHTGDVLLVEGNTRISTGIKYLTQSTWSHAGLYVGPITDRSEPEGEPHSIVEALVEEGVVSAPLRPSYTDLQAARTG